MKEDTVLNLGKKEFVRKKLENMLSDVMDKKLWLIVAPSGYGKSTLARHFFLEGNLRDSCVWFSIHREEKDENWIWHRVCDRFAAWNTELGQKLSQLNIPNSKQEQSYVVKLLQKYITSPMYLIVDDFQELESRLLNEIFEDLIEKVEELHIILISRTYPNLPYEEILLRGKCVILNQENLTLSREEIAQIYEENQISLSEPGLDEIAAYTDGWISAVYLSLYEYRKHGGFGGFFGVNQLLKKAIFDKLSPQMQELYKRVSIFEWFDIKGVSYVTEVDFAEHELFECIEQFGFVHYDVRTHIFEMHTLLRNVAKAELKKSGTDISRLYNRAGTLSKQRGVYVQAINYYRMAKNWEEIAALYAGEHGRSIMEQAPDLFQEVREDIWDCIWEKYLMAVLHHLYFLAMHENIRDVRPIYDRIWQDIQVHGRWQNDYKILGEMFVIKAALQFNNLEHMNESLHTACDMLGYETSEVLGGSLLTYGTVCMTALYYMESGSLKDVIVREKQYAKSYMHLTSGGYEGWDEFFDAEYAMLTGDMERAYNLAQMVCQKTSLSRQTCIVISCYYMMLRCLMYYGKKALFEEKMQQLQVLLEKETRSVLVTDMELVMGYMYACLGDRSRMPKWLVDFKLENCSKTVRNIRSGCMTYGRLLCSEQQWELLDIIAGQMLVPYEDRVHLQPLVVGNIYKAIARYHTGYPEVAIGYLKEAAALAKPDGFILPFIENGEELRPMLKEMSDDSFFKSVLEHLEQYTKGLRAFRGIPEREKVSLTKREAELMGYVKAGYRNADISREMHIALVTVEKNLTNIYRKLDVPNRTAAIAKLEELEKEQS